MSSELRPVGPAPLQPPHPQRSAPHHDPQPTRYRSGFSAAALALGIVSIPFNIALVPGILAWVFGALGSRDARQAAAAGEDTRRALRMARTGMILGIAMTVIVPLEILVAIAIPVFVAVERGN